MEKEPRREEPAIEQERNSPQERWDQKVFHIFNNFKHFERGYRALAGWYHPDSKTELANEEKFKEINQARDSVNEQKILENLKELSGLLGRIEARDNLKQALQIEKTSEPSESPAERLMAEIAPASEESGGIMEQATTDADAQPGEENKKIEDSRIQDIATRYENINPDMEEEHPDDWIEYIERFSGLPPEEDEETKDKKELFERFNGIGNIPPEKSKQKPN
ncbi:MAG: hypothetical protein WC470_02110 [Candidatus Paceibacterota bacterium]